MCRTAKECHKIGLHGQINYANQYIFKNIHLSTVKISCSKVKWHAYSPLNCQKMLDSKSSEQRTPDWNIMKTMKSLLEKLCTRSSSGFTSLNLHGLLNDVYAIPSLLIAVSRLCLVNAATTWLSKVYANVQDYFTLLHPPFLVRLVLSEFQNELEPVLKSHQAEDENVQF